jgi:hypothetical protein
VEHFDGRRRRCFMFEPNKAAPNENVFEIYQKEQINFKQIYP